MVKSFSDWVQETKEEKIDELFFSKPKFHYVGRDCTYVVNPEAAARQFGQKHVDDCIRRHEEINKKQKGQRPYDVNSKQRISDIQSRLGDYDSSNPQGHGAETPRLQAAHADNGGPSLNEWLVLSGIKEIS